MTNRLRSLLHPGSESISMIKRVMLMIFISFSLSAVLSAWDMPPIEGYTTLHLMLLRLALGNTT